MARVMIAVVSLLIFALPARAGDGSVDALGQWGQWRGPVGSGVAPHAQPPLRWDENTNVRWKVAIPGKGHSTPVVWGDRLFITTAVHVGPRLRAPAHEPHGAHDNQPAVYEYEFIVMAVARKDGQILWQRTVRKERPHQSTHLTGSWASASAVTDGEHVIASFGSRGIYCFDFAGTLLWQVDIGDMQVKHGHGEGSSPALYGDTVVINWDHEGQSYVIALDKRTGTERWKISREEGTSWSSPLIVEHDGKAQVVIAATNRVRGYDLADGRVIWECGGLSGNVVASPVAGDGYVYVGSSYEKRAMMAIRLDAAKGDITQNDEAVVWRRDRHTPYVPSPLLYGDELYFLKHYQGLLTCLRAKTGEALYGPERLAGIENVYASIVGAAERVYIVSLNGTTLVLSRGAPFTILSRNHLDDTFAASPALVDGELFLRGERFLYCIAEPVKSAE